jgi:actin
MVEERPVIIIDNGSGHVKAGMSGDEAPSTVFPALVGRPKHGTMMPGTEKRDYLMGEEALSKKGVLSITYPIEHGVVTDWADLEKVWHYTFFDALRVDPEKHAVIVTEAPMNPKKNRERMIEMLFEKFSCPAAFVVIQAVMSLYAAGRTTGCVVDSGDGVTHVVPVYEGYCMPHAIQRLDLAGRDLSEYMVKILTETGITMMSSSEKELVRDLKEQMCYVIQGTLAEEMKKVQAHPTDYEKLYTLPDGNTVAVTSECFRVPEVLFDPMMSGRELPGIHMATWTCVMKCEIDIRRDLLNNIVLSGGTTMFPGIAERLTSEIKALAPKKVDVRVIANPERRYVVWMGASIVAQLSRFPQMLIWKTEYDEVGPGIVHTKCLL